MRKLAYLVGLFVLASLPAVAQEGGSKDVSVEYSYIRANPATSGFPSFNANGGSASFALNPRNWYGFAGEFGDYHVGQIGGAGVDTNLITYMFGPQFYFHHFSRFTPFAQELFGGAHSSSSAFGIPGSRNSFAMALGGGVDVPFKGHMSVRLGPVDYLMTDFAEPSGSGSRKLQNNLRVSGGVRWRF
jgi:opacity protein-like surface antigen